MIVTKDTNFSVQDGNRGVVHLLVTPNASEHFGEHVMIDGYECSEERLNNREIVLSCLDELPTRLLMKPLAKPEVYFAKGNSPKDSGGWTGLVVVEESHISIHTFPKLLFVSIDVYTCRNGLKIPDIESYFGEKLGVRIFETNFVKRGLQFTELALTRIETLAIDHGGIVHAS